MTGRHKSRSSFQCTVPWLVLYKACWIKGILNKCFSFQVPRAGFFIPRSSSTLLKPTSQTPLNCFVHFFLLSLMWPLRLLLLLQSRVLANTDSGITDGCSPQVAVDHKGANLASVTETNISSKGVYVSGCWSSPAANTVFRFPKDEI